MAEGSLPCGFNPEVGRYPVTMEMPHCILVNIKSKVKRMERYGLKVILGLIR